MYYKGNESAAAFFLCNDINDMSEKKKAENLSKTLQKLYLTALNNNFPRCMALHIAG